MKGMVEKVYFRSKISIYYGKNPYIRACLSLLQTGIYSLLNYMNITEAVVFLKIVCWNLPTSKINHKLFEKVHNVSKVPRMNMEKTLIMTSTIKERFQIFHKCFLYYLHQQHSWKKLLWKQGKASHTENDLGAIVQ